MKIPFDFDQMEFLEFIYLFERLAEQKQKENEEQRKANGMLSLNQLGGQ